MGWFLSGTLIGPALGESCRNSELRAQLTDTIVTGPFIGGIIVTYRSWRDIFWLQTALAGTAVILCFFAQPETIHVRRSTELEGLKPTEKAQDVAMAEPIPRLTLVSLPQPPSGRTWIMPMLRQNHVLTFSRLFLLPRSSGTCTRF